jgi:predicted transcriptional regulator
VVSTGVVAFAATDTTNALQKKAVPAVIAGMTETQRDAVRQARTDSMTEAVAELVERGTITQDIADKLTAVKDLQQKDKIGIGALTEEQRTALRDAEAAELKNGIAALVDAGTITQAQADQMSQGHKMMKGLDLTDEQRDALMQVRDAAMKAAAADLVEKGTLTQAEADAITAMIQSRPSVEKTAGEKPTGFLTDEQKTALADAVKASLESKLSSLVDAGTITQDQADQLLSDPGALRMGPGRPGGRGHGHGPDSDAQNDTTI